MPAFDGFITAMFQSVTARTAGFNTVDLSTLPTSALIATIFLMFIGGSSGSTAGGIRTSTFTLIILSAFATIRGKRNLELMKHNIPWDALNKAFSIFIFAATFLFTNIFVLSILEPSIDVVELAFEAVSAFGTVGLSTGITAGLGDWSKAVLMISMFVGRVGTLTLGYALSQKVVSVDYKYPNGHFLVG